METKKVTIIMPKNLWADYKKEAINHEVTLAKYIEDILMKHYERKSKNKSKNSIDS